MKNKIKSNGNLSDFDVGILKKFLNDAIQKEEFEVASKIRDLIKNKKNEENTKSRR